MAAHSFLVVGDFWCLAARESYIPEVATLFQESDLVHEGVYETTTGRMRDRLLALGITPSWVRQRLLVAAQTAYEKNEHGEDASVSAIGLLDRLTTAVNSSPEVVDNVGGDVDQDPIFNALTWEDARLAVALLVDAARSADMEVIYNLSDLTSRGYLEPKSTVTDEARLEAQQRLMRSSRLIVLTEGSSDSQLLTLGARVTHPHMNDFLSFMDFSSDAPGGAGALTKHVQSLMAAGVAHRVVAIADNDTAAHEALGKWITRKLPDNYRLMHYPNIDILRSYPIRGPMGVVSIDINGIAGSLEMYLGTDVLADSAGKLTPVQLTGWSARLDRYQASLPTTEKQRIQKAFRAKVTLTLRTGRREPGQDWSGIEAIVDAVVNAFETPRTPWPIQTDQNAE